jgi:tetratricopeptide (TPR) repeat protein
LAVPADLETIVLKATAKDPTSRYATAQELADDLRSYLEDRPIRARRPTLADRARRWGRRHRTLAWSAAMTALVAALMLAGGIGYVARDRAARLALTGQRVAESLAGARTAIEAGDLTLAGQRVAESQGHLGPERDRLPDVGAEIDRIRREIEARQADAARFSQFLKRTSDAQDGMSMGKDLHYQREGEEALGLYDVLTETDWSSRLENSFLTVDQRQQVRETAYVTLVSLADFGVRWGGLREDPKSVARSLDLLQRAQAFHQPTRAFYFVRSQCRRRQGDTAAADEDDKQFKAAPARTAWDYYLPGHTAGWGGDLDEAIRSYQAALRLQPNHFNSMYFLAMRLTTDKIKRYPEAIAYYTGCLALRPDHFGAYISRGTAYHRLGRLDEAEADHKAALALAKDDPDRCMSLYSLASDFTERREYSRAEPLLVQALEVGRRFFGEDHPETLMVMNRLGVLYDRQGQDAKAESLFAKALEGRRRVSGEEQRETLALMHNLADVYRRRGKLAEAETLLVRLLEVGRRVQGEEHLDILHNTEDLAGVYEDRHEYSKAEPLWGQALEIRRRVQGEEHADTLRCMHNLAANYKNQGEFIKAEPLFIKTLEIGRRVHGETHPDVLTAASSLAELYYLNRKFEHTISLLEQAWPKALKQPDLPVAPLTAISVTLGPAYEQAGQFARAESLYREALETVRQRHKEVSSDSILLQVVLADNLLKQQRSAEAEPLLRECLKFREQNQPGNWSTFNTKSRLGGALLGQKKYAEAEPLLLAGYEGMKQREETIPRMIRKVRLSEAIELLVQLYDQWGRKDKADEWRTKRPVIKSAARLDVTDLPADVFARP